MANNTAIQWTNRTMNPLRVKDSRTFYCVKVSPACTNCYAEKMAKRLAGMGGTKFYPYKHMENPPEIELNLEMLKSWPKTKKPYMNFVTSMTDLFGEFVPKWMIFGILDAMVRSPLQVFQILTKRSSRMYNIVDEYCHSYGIPSLPENIWMGVTVESQKYYDERIRTLIQARVKVRWLSMEPLLGPVDLRLQEGTKSEWINWVVVGGETGPKKVCRPTHPEWFRSIQRQCAEANVAFFFKQWGNYKEVPVETEKDIVSGHWRYGWATDLSADMPKFGVKGDDIDDLSATWMKYMPKKQAGELLDGVAYRQFPAIDHPAIPEE